VRTLDLPGGGEVIAEADCWTLLSEVRFGRLAVVAGGRPDIFPVNFEVDGTSILLRSCRENRAWRGGDGHSPLNMVRIHASSRVCEWPSPPLRRFSRQLLRTNMGRKLLAALTEEVAFEVDGIDPVARTGWSVVVHGRAVDMAGGKGAAPEGGPVTWAGPKDFLLRIDPRSVSGRRVGPTVLDAQGRTS
jgi:hypothetical protein